MQEQTLGQSFCLEKMQIIHYLAILGFCSNLLWTFFIYKGELFEKEKVKKMLLDLQERYRIDSLASCSDQRTRCLKKQKKWR